MHSCKRAYWNSRSSIIQKNSPMVFSWIVMNGCSNFTRHKFYDGQKCIDIFKNYEKNYCRSIELSGGSGASWLLETLLQFCSTFTLHFYDLMYLSYCIDIRFGKFDYRRFEYAHIRWSALCHAKITKTRHYDVSEHANRNAGNDKRIITEEFQSLTQTTTKIRTNRSEFFFLRFVWK